MAEKVNHARCTERQWEGGDAPRFLAWNYKNKIPNGRVTQENRDQLGAPEGVREETPLGPEVFRRPVIPTDSGMGDQAPHLSPRFPAFLHDRRSTSAASKGHLGVINPRPSSRGLGQSKKMQNKM